MSRKRPARLRRANHGGYRGEIPGVGSRVADALDRLERPELRSQKIAAVFHEWVNVCRKPTSVLSAEHNDWAGLIGPIARDRLEQAVQALPRHLNRELRTQLSRWDQRFEARTVPDPTRNPCASWWWQRQGVR